MDISVLVSFLYIIVTTKAQANSDCSSGSLYPQEAADTYSIDQGYWYLNLQFPSSCSGQVTRAYEVKYYDMQDGNNQVHIALWKQGEVEGTYEMVPLSSQVLERNDSDKRRKRSSSDPGSEGEKYTDIYVRNGTFVGVFFRNSEVTLPVIGITSNNHKVCKQQGSTTTISLDCRPSSSSIFSNLLIRAKVYIDVIECFALENINEGTPVYIDGDMQYGARARYQCNTGYEIISGNVNLTCDENGDWNGTIPTCQIINCPIPSEPLNGKLDKTNMYSYGSVISFSCDTGFVLIGNSELTCQADKSWNGSIPTCNSIQCDDPISLANGVIVSGDSYTINSTITFTCNNSRKLIGNKTAICLSNKEWSNDFPKCLNQCHLLQVSDMVIITPQKDTYLEGEVVMFSCIQEYTLDGANSISCESSGIWNGIVPTCYIIFNTSAITISSTTTNNVTDSGILSTTQTAINQTDNTNTSSLVAITISTTTTSNVTDSGILSTTQTAINQTDNTNTSSLVAITISTTTTSNVTDSGILSTTQTAINQTDNTNTSSLVAITISTTTTSNVTDSGILLTTQTAVNQTDNTNTSSLVAIAVVIPLALIGLVIIVLTIVITILVLMWRKRDYKTKDNDLRETLIRLPNKIYGDSVVVPVNESGLINPVYEGDNVVETIYSEPQFTSYHNYESCDTEDGPFQRVGNDSNLIKESVYWEPGRNIRVIYEQIANRNYRHIDRQEIKTIHHLGSGQFGTVDQGEWTTQDGQTVDVAIKSLKGSVSEEEQIRFLQEAAISGQFHHSNVLQLLGVVTDGHPTLMILEYLKNGDLKSCLERLKPVPGELCDDTIPSLLLRFSHQVACGMAYLSRIRFVHRDLAARNILVSEGNVCKIADFGMSKDLQDENYYRPGPSSRNLLVPIKWTAPEAIHFKKYSTHSDVWSYGAVLYEIWSVGHKPFEQHTNQACIRLVDSGWRLPAPPGCPRSIYELMIICWNPVSSDRPSFSKLENELAIINIDNVSGSLGCNHADNDCSLYPDLQNIYKQN